jgi:inner membrane protein
MTGKEHVGFAIYSATLVVAGRYVPDMKDTLNLIIGIWIGSLLPDIDHEKSILGRFSPIPWLHKILKKIGIHLFKHGGITHTALVNIIILILAYLYNSSLLWGIAFGYFTHLYIDDATGNKLQMLWFPFKSRKGR